MANSDQRTSTMVIESTSDDVFHSEINHSSIDSSGSVPDNEQSLNASVGSVSLNCEMRNVEKLLSFLKNYSPEKKRVTRKGAANAKNSRDKPNLQTCDITQKIIDYLDEIYILNQKFQKQIEALKEENKVIRSKLDLQNNQSPTYAKVTKTTDNSNTSTNTNNAPITGVTAKHHVVAPAPSYKGGHSPALNKLSSKLDQLEQDSLCSVLSVRGQAVDKLLSEKTNNTNNSQGVRPKDGNFSYPPPEKSSHHVKELSVKLLSTVADVTPGDVSDVVVVGTEKKHLKITFSTRQRKQYVLHEMKTKKPSDIFASEYLTKRRSALFYKMRCMKKRFSKISAVYIRYGSVFYKTGETSKPIAIRDVTDINKLEEYMLNSN